MVIRCFCENSNSFKSPLQPENMDLTFGYPLPEKLVDVPMSDWRGKDYVTHLKLKLRNYHGISDYLSFLTSAMFLSISFIVLINFFGQLVHFPKPAFVQNPFKSVIDLYDYTNEGICFCSMGSLSRHIYQSCGIKEILYLNFVLRFQFLLQKLKQDFALPPVNV